MLPASSADCSLPRLARLRSGYQYDAVRARGTTKRGPLFRLSCLSHPERTTNNELLPQCGIIVSRRVGGAVVRNRVKRRLRDLYRNERFCLAPNLWLVIVATPKAATASLTELREEWLHLGEHLAIFREEQGAIHRDRSDRKDEGR